MTKFLRNLGRAALPERAWHASRRLIRYDGWHTEDAGRRSRRRLAGLRDRHIGERCIIVGNGPSLLRTDLSLLDGEIVFGLNRIYVGLETFGLQLEYFVCVNDLVSSQFAADIATVRATKFLSWRNRRDLAGLDDDSVFIRTSAPCIPFATDARAEMWEGGTVTYIALQLAYHMGFTTVVLVGVDHRFEVDGPANSEEIAEGPDQNHFDPRYFADGVRWNLPDLERSTHAYKMARQIFEADGRIILDATVGGALEVFPKIPLVDALALDGKTPCA